MHRKLYWEIFLIILQMCNWENDRTMDDKHVSTFAADGAIAILWKKGSCDDKSNNAPPMRSLSAGELCSFTSVTCLCARSGTGIWGLWSPLHLQHVQTDVASSMFGSRHSESGGGQEGDETGGSRKSDVVGETEAWKRKPERSEPIGPLIVISLWLLWSCAQVKRQLC